MENVVVNKLNEIFTKPLILVAQIVFAALIINLPLIFFLRDSSAVRIYSDIVFWMLVVVASAIILRFCWWFVRKKLSK